MTTLDGYHHRGSMIMTWALWSMLAASCTSNGPQNGVTPVTTAGNAETTAAGSDGGESTSTSTSSTTTSGDEVSTSDGGESSGSETTGGAGAGVDEFGIKKIYPDKPGGFFIKQTGGGDVEEHGDYRREWEIDSPKYTDIEVTGYFKVHIEREDTISIKTKGAHHRDSEFNACNNIHYVPFSGGDGLNTGKQCPHLNYKKQNFPPQFTLGDIRDKWIGVKAIEWNEGANVHWQTWIDENNDNNWKLWIDFVESKGTIGDDSETETPFTESPWGPHADSSATLPPTILMRVDFPEQPPENDVEAKSISAREIVVTM